MKRYRFEADLRSGAPAPPADGYEPSGQTPPPPAPLAERDATPQHEAVYQRLRAEVRAARPERTAERHVFEHRGCRHLITREGDVWVAEVRLDPDGSLVRRVYERMDGPSQNLDGLFQRGMSGLETDEARFSAHPGYELRIVRYCVSAGRLRKLRMGQAAFHRDQGRIVLRDF